MQKTMDNANPDGGQYGYTDTDIPAVAAMATRRRGGTIGSQVATRARRNLLVRALLVDEYSSYLVLSSQGPKRDEGAPPWRLGQH